MNSIIGCDRLPIEILQKIFHYLYCHEIYLAFYNLNSYLNETIETYDQYRIDFESISMSNFDYTLRYIQPNQILSLTLSNLDDTPGQFRLFLSLFSLKQFSRLEYLQLLHPTNSIDLNQIVADLPALESLQSFAILHCQSTSVNQQTFLILSSYLHNSKSLRQLTLSGYLNHLFDHTFISSSIEHLYFNENICNTISLETMAICMPHLKSLDTSITTKIHLPIFQHLTRLILTVFINLTTSDLTVLLNSMNSLEFFKIIANGKQWFKGQFWEESLPKNLRIFQFNFFTQSIRIDEEMIFETFQTNFWLEKKRWFVMLDYQMNPSMTHLYSLPYCNTHFFYRPTIDPTRKSRSTMPVDRTYLNNVTDLTIDLSVLITESFSTISSTHTFSNISNLILSDIDYQLSIEPLFNFFQSILDLTHITRLELGHFYHPDLISMLYKHMSQLSSLRITQTLLNRLDTMNFSNISRLSICDCLTDSSRVCSMFPNAKYLRVKVSSFEQMREVMEFLGNNFIHVTYRQVNDDLRKEFISWLNEFYNNQRRFTYEIDQHMNLHIWFNDRNSS